MLNTWYTIATSYTCHVKVITCTLLIQLVLQALERVTVATSSPLCVHVYVHMYLDKLLLNSLMMDDVGGGGGGGVLQSQYGTVLVYMYMYSKCR